IYLQFGLLFPLFATAFLTESGISVPRWAKLAVWIGATETLVGYVLIWVLPSALFSGMGSTVANEVRIPVTVALFALTIVLLATGSRVGAAENRHRFALLLVAIGLIYLSNILYAVFDSLTRSNPRLLTDVSAAGRCLGAGLFIY